MMNDCELPSNIAKRKNELKQMEERLAPIQNEFFDLKSTADEGYKQVSKDNKIRDLIVDTETELKNIDKERAYLLKFLNSRILEKYQPEDFKCENASNPISEVRQLKNLIKSTNGNIDNVSSLISELGKEIIQADLKNGSQILEKKAAQLFDRLNMVKGSLHKIDKCTEGQDGNYSNDEEEEFIDALREEIPEVYEGVNANFKNIEEF